MTWFCEGHNREPHHVPFPGDRTELKVEALRAGDHGRRFHSRILARYCRDCASGWWAEHVEGRSTEEVQESLLG